MSDWWGIHAFLRTTDDIRPALNAVQSRVEGVKSSNNEWFFILYGEGGLHLRIRLGAGIREYAEDVRQDLLRLMASPTIPLTGSSRPMPFWKSDKDWHRPGAVEHVAYVPETERYGGINALAINERLFGLSSRLACSAWKKSVNDGHILAKVAVDMMLAAAGGICSSPAEAALFFSDYASFWSAYLGITETGFTMDRGSVIRSRFLKYSTAETRPRSSREPSQLWRAALVDARASFVGLAKSNKLICPSSGRPVSGERDTNAAVRSIFQSQLHMNNNRFGCSPQQEFLWATEIAAALLQ